MTDASTSECDGSFWGTLRQECEVSGWAIEEVSGSEGPTSGLLPLKDCVM